MRTRRRESFWIVRRLFHHLLVIVGSVGLTLVFFLVLPLMQTLTKPLTPDLLVQSVDTGKLEAPEPPPEEPVEKQPEPEEEPPKLIEDTQPLDLSQLEMALNPGVNEGLLAGDFVVKLNSVVSESTDMDALFSLSDLDQKPRVIYQPAPVLTAELRKKAPGTVYLVFVVDQQGRVEE
ncbi:MAG TPA: hypothetical protein PKH07_19645, partial [bacterium]|nr:hypothetical protein [bacterium]